MNTTQTIKYWAVHEPKEHPNFGFETKAEARAFINGFALKCAKEHSQKEVLCEGALAEWRIDEVNDFTKQ